MTQLAFDRRGSGPPLILVHGIGSRRGVWDPVIPHLTHERETIALDLPGFGDSAPLPPETTPDVEGLAAAVERFAADLGIERPHVAGNSLGGGIVLELARRGTVASATALSPVGFWSRPELAYSRLVLRASRLAARHLAGPTKRLLRSPWGRRIALGAMYARPARRDPHEAVVDLEQLAAAPAFDATLKAFGDHVFRDGTELRDVPVTIGWGVHDRLLLTRQAQRARAALPAARHLALPGCGHIPMSDDPEGVAALLLEGSA